MGTRVKPVQPTEIKDIKIVREAIAQIRRKPSHPKRTYKIMSARISISRKNFGKFLHIEQLSPGTPLDGFSCSIQEYNDYLTQDASCGNALPGVLLPICHS
ncbi:hypothetical protein AGMMS49942_20900 [Spirochaetia bacterium]|nr:hypothetical protein AGMMS49942_20900 [Spirochaetia bacterium]